jgi:hypothetical protein
MGKLKNMADTDKEMLTESPAIDGRKVEDSIIRVPFKVLDMALNYSQTPSFQNAGLTPHGLELMYSKLTAMEDAYSKYRDDMPKQPAGLNLGKYAALIVKDGGTTTPTLGQIKSKMVEIKEDSNIIGELDKYLDAIDDYHANGNNIIDIHTEKIELKHFGIITVGIYENFKFLFE